MLLEGLKVFIVSFVFLEVIVLSLCEFTKILTDMLFDKYDDKD